MPRSRTRAKHYRRESERERDREKRERERERERERHVGGGRASLPGSPIPVRKETRSRDRGSHGYRGDCIYERRGRSVAVDQDRASVDPHARARARERERERERERCTGHIPRSIIPSLTSKTNKRQLHSKGTLLLYLLSPPPSFPPRPLPPAVFSLPSTLLLASSLPATAALINSIHRSGFLLDRAVAGALCSLLGCETISSTLSLVLFPYFPCPCRTFTAAAAAAAAAAGFSR
jgi:hypothetical protein